MTLTVPVTTHDNLQLSLQHIQFVSSRLAGICLTIYKNGGSVYAQKCETNHFLFVKMRGCVSKQHFLLLGFVRYVAASVQRSC